MHSFLEFLDQEDRTLISLTFLVKAYTACFMAQQSGLRYVVCCDRQKRNQEMEEGRGSKLWWILSSKLQVVEQGERESRE